ncbi:PREDICTED: ADAMTS-like protein 2 [Gekko japonicus]|uniref:ADAMTS-like protein 2 n=1 Tax=Gekko japonicus TaxID=146911 RepID=A0ABM1LF97_GEKJA|nr:PREDICTED: ADAMTS-like protein 2 [Gekko japonicus]
MAAPPAFSGRRRLAPPALLLLLACALRAKDSSEAVDGGGTWNEEVTKWWGEWSSWSTCSRTCGGGVMSRERHCLQQRLQASQGTNSTMCLGQSKHYQLCQQQLCPANTASFKQHQCASFNAKAFGKYYYHWMPLYPDDYTSISNKPCDLQCTTRGGERQLMARAQDGTSCKDRTFQGVCITGKCEPIGCDGSLYSSQTMDRCRVCGGDGSTCYRVSGSFRKGISQLGYVFITNIPAGATDILIIERRKTENILALADESGHFFFNGNSVIDNPQNFRVAGTVFKYRRPSNLHSDSLEYIIAQGPTNQSLNAMYYNFNGKMPYVTYDYTVPRTRSPALQTVPPAIKMPLYLRLPEPSHNHQDAIPSISQDFNATWISLAPDDLGERFPQGEGHGALRLNQITISTAVPHGAARPDLLETGRIGPSRLRLFKKLCLRDPRNAAFCRELQYLLVKLGRKNSTVGFWNDPLVEWPEGLRKRPANENFLESTNAEVYALDEATNDTVVVTSSKPSSKSSLHTSLGNEQLSEPLQSPGPESNDFELNPLGHEDISLADMYRWKVSVYAPCSSTCTSGISTSYALCIRYDGIEVEEAYCDALTRPEPTHEFCAGRDCQPRWETSRWSECSRTCGEGYQYRTVRCWKMLAPGFDSSVYDDLCESAGLARPMERKSCVNKPCGPQWELSEWSECSARCGSSGTMKREVRCSIEPHLCNESLRPVSEKDCSGPPCDRQWTASDWGPCNATCGRGVKTRTVLCAGLENGMYREYPEKRCDASPKPEVQASCFKRPCSTWFSTSWSQCSKTCGTGLRVREVKCYQGEALGHGCDSSSKPEAKQICQLQLCPTDAPDEDCEDKASANCVLVLKVKLCSHCCVQLHLGTQEGVWKKFVAEDGVAV